MPTTCAAARRRPATAPPTSSRLWCRDRRVSWQSEASHTQLRPLSCRRAPGGGRRGIRRLTIASGRSAGRPRGLADQCRSDVTGQDLRILGQLAWHPAHLSIHGTVTAALPRQTSIGWVWWLIGQYQVVGFMVDDLARADVSPVLLSLPLPPQTSGISPDDRCGPVRVTIGTGGQGDRTVPANVNETELVNNPGRSRRIQGRSASRSPTRSGSSARRRSPWSPGLAQPAHRADRIVEAAVAQRSQAGQRRAPGRKPPGLALNSCCPGSPVSPRSVSAAT